MVTDIFSRLDDLKTLQLKYNQDYNPYCKENEIKVSLIFSEVMKTLLIFQRERQREFNKSKMAK